MAKYTGRRIVPKHAGEWDIRKEYEELQIVLDADSGNSFISNLPVPKGTALSDEKYWSLFSLHSEQIAEAEEHLTQTAEDIRSELSETENRINKNVSDTEGRINEKPLCFPLPFFHRNILESTGLMTPVRKWSVTAYLRAISSLA